MVQFLCLAVFRAFLLDAQLEKDSVEKKMSRSLFVFLGQLLIVVSPPLCGRQVAGSSGLTVMVPFKVKNSKRCMGSHT